MAVKREQFSVCMSVYHGDDARCFQMAMESLLNQTVPPDEIILVVDGPVGETLDKAIAGYETADTVRVERLAENRGLGNARKVGMALCSYDLIAMMDADDLSVPDRFEKQLAAFEENPEAAIIGGRIAEFIGEPQNVVGIRPVVCTDAGIREDLKRRCPFNHVTVMLRKQAVAQVGGYMDWFSNEDYYLWIRMYLAGLKFGNVPDVLVNVRVGEDMYRRRGGWKYFRSELGLQNYMLRHKIIGFGTYAVNVAKRLIVQVLLPNTLRAWVYKLFARS